MQHMFYPEDLLRSSRIKKKRSLTAAALLAAPTVAAVAVLLSCTDAFNERTMRYTAEAVAAAAGCAVILCLRRAFSLRAYGKHVTVMRAGPEVCLSGRLSAPGKTRELPGGIAFRPLVLTTEDGEKALSVSVKNAALLPPAGTPVRVGTVHGFITGWEATE